MVEQKKYTYFIGIGGCGMSGLAKILLESGQKVAGSDLKKSQTTEVLERLGAKIFYGHRADNINDDVKVVVKSTAIKEENPELKKAKDLEIPVIHRGDLLAELTHKQKAINVAGAHGKTTTTSMLAYALLEGNLDPTIVVGANLEKIGGNALLGKGEYLVAEADESDGSFLKLKSHVGIITNIEDDHLDYYGSLDKLIAAFEEFLAKIPEQGFAVVCQDNEQIRNLLAKKKGKIITYGLEQQSDYMARNIDITSAKTKADIYYQDELLGELVLSVPGIHNVLNALAAIATCHQLGLDFTTIARGLGKFAGAGRRFQQMGEYKGIKVIDDYAHHPTEIKATLQGAKQLNRKKLWAIFQPHRYTRTKQLYKEFGQSFADADFVIINSIYAASEEPLPGVTAELIVDEIKKTGKPVLYFSEQADITDYLVSHVKEDELVITIGAGNICNLGPRFLENLTKK